MIVNSYNAVWRPVIAIAERLRLKPAKPIRNWVAPHDVGNLLELAGLEQVTLWRRILLPKRIPLLSGLLNGGLGNLWPFNYLCLTWWIVARPLPKAAAALSVSRSSARRRNEAGPHRADSSAASPTIGTDTELIFVEGNSTDDTREEIERQIARHPERDAALRRPDRGAARATRSALGFDGGARRRADRSSTPT